MLLQEVPKYYDIKPLSIILLDVFVMKYLLLTIGAAAILATGLLTVLNSETAFAAQGHGGTTGQGGHGGGLGDGVGGNGGQGCGGGGKGFGGSGGGIGGGGNGVGGIGGTGGCPD